MPPSVEIAVVLTTYERPEHLERSLASLALQQGVDGKFEVIVTDDGSKDQTPGIVRRFAPTVSFPLKWVTHGHRGFRVSLCRNDGVRASSAPYFLFTDSDCIFPPDHLQKHLQARKPKVIRAGDCLRFDRQTTDRIDTAAICSGAYRGWVTWDERQRLFIKKLKEQYYQLRRHASKPKLTGCNIGISRDDLEAVNGFDESFVGWGCEDDDLAYRLRKAGRRIASALGYTYAYHMWHPTHPSRTAKWNDGPNVERLQHLDRPIQCVAGLIPAADPQDGSAYGDSNSGMVRTPWSSKHAA
jgi:GT2 family glycosyltransferase